MQKAVTYCVVTVQRWSLKIFILRICTVYVSLVTSLWNLPTSRNTTLYIGLKLFGSCLTKLQRYVAFRSYFHPKCGNSENHRMNFRYQKNLKFYKLTYFALPPTDFPCLNECSTVFFCHCCIQHSSGQRDIPVKNKTVAWRLEILIKSIVCLRA